MCWVRAAEAARDFVETVSRTTKWRDAPVAERRLMERVGWRHGGVNDVQLML